MPRASSWYPEESRCEGVVPRVRGHVRIRYYGHIGQPTGYGRAAMDMCMALLGQGAELQIVPIARDAVLPKEFLPLASHLGGDSRRPDVVIAHTLPLDCAR